MYLLIPPQKNIIYLLFDRNPLLLTPVYLFSKFDPTIVPIVCSLSVSVPFILNLFDLTVFFDLVNYKAL